MEPHLYGTVEWTDLNDSVHQIDGHEFTITGYESSADELSIFYKGNELVHYVHTLGGRSITVDWDAMVELPLAQAMQLVFRAGLALADRFTMASEAVTG